MAEIPDINTTEKWIVETTLKERYGEPVEYKLGDAEIRLSPSDRTTSSCPLVYREKDGCHFAIFKTGDKNYRCQFFYRGHQQYGTGVHEYDELAECAVSLLQAQADHAAGERGDLET